MRNECVEKQTQIKQCLALLCWGFELLLLSSRAGNFTRGRVDRRRTTSPCRDAQPVGTIAISEQITVVIEGSAAAHFAFRLDARMIVSHNHAGSG
jgi:hypothetical protein